MNWHKIIRYGILRRLIPGKRAHVFLTLRCNLDCPYCTNKFVLDRKHYDELESQHWIALIDSWRNVNEIFLTGGEPFLYPGLESVLRHLIEKKYLVTIYTNLLMAPEWFCSGTMPRALTLRIVATRHNGLTPAQQERFDLNYERLKDAGCRIIAERFDGHDVLLGHDASCPNGIETKPMIVADDEKMDCLLTRFRAYAPNGELVTTRMELLTGVEY